MRDCLSLLGKLYDRCSIDHWCLSACIHAEKKIEWLFIKEKFVYFIVLQKCKIQMYLITDAFYCDLITVV